MIKSGLESYGTKWPLVLFEVALCTVNLLGPQLPASVTVAGCALRARAGSRTCTPVSYVSIHQAIRSF